MQRLAQNDETGEMNDVLLLEFGANAFSTQSFVDLRA